MAQDPGLFQKGSRQKPLDTPADVWPTAPGWVTEANCPDCYRRLYQLCESGDHPHGDERRRLWQAVKQSRPDSYLAWQLANVTRWSTPDYLEVDEQFTPLHVTIKVREKNQPMAERQQLTAETMEQALAIVFEQHDAPATVLLAPPGGGKSTVLRHYHLQQARQLDASKRLVFYVQLRDYRPDESATEPALRWLEAQWENETQNAWPLEDFLRWGNLTLLLDGLNEIPRESQSDYRQRVQEWRYLIDAVEAKYSGVRLLFSCRPLDYSQRIDLGRETPLPEVEVLAMEPDQIHAFITRKYRDAPAIAERVWDQLKDHPSFELYSSPYYLTLLLQQIRTDIGDVAIPDNRAALFSGMVKARMRRECQINPQSRLHDVEILSERDRIALDSGRTDPLWLPDDTCFFEVVAELAYQIQEQAKGNERWGKLRWKDALKTAERIIDDGSIANEYLSAACDLSLFEDDAAQAKELRFIHQLMQEYFAAWTLAQRGDAAKVNSPWRSMDIIPSAQELLAQDGGDELPELPTTGWEETALMAANLIDEPEQFIREMMEHNLPLAGRCAAQADVEISGALINELRAELRERSVHPEADLRARILAGKALGELDDPERFTVLTSAKGTKYLLPKFVEIPAGNYTIGGDPEGITHLESSEPLQVCLERFEIGIHPVTNAEFHAFIKAGAYEDDDYWSGQALAWRNGHIGEDAIRQQVRKYIEKVIDAVGKTASPEEIKAHYTTMSMDSAKWYHEHIVLSDDELHSRLLAKFPTASGVPFVKPGWHSQKWSNPAQPVVGVCWYEAVAYCQWLSAQSGEATLYRLPSEAEWEAAGRGVGAWRDFAWPGEFDPLKANTAETRLGVTTPVGIFPEGRTPVSRLQDISGNVFEWISTPRGEPGHWLPTLRESDGDADEWRVVRGGCWNEFQVAARLGSRFINPPNLRGNILGFRVSRTPHLNTVH